MDSPNPTPNYRGEPRSGGRSESAGDVRVGVPRRPEAEWTLSKAGSVRSPRGDNLPRAARGASGRSSGHIADRPQTPENQAKPDSTACPGGLSAGDAGAESVLRAATGRTVAFQHRGQLPTHPRPRGEVGRKAAGEGSAQALGVCRRRFQRRATYHRPARWLSARPVQGADRPGV
jgi:hypothetical protein